MQPKIKGQRSSIGGGASSSDIPLGYTNFTKFSFRDVTDVLNTLIVIFTPIWLQFELVFVWLTRFGAQAAILRHLINIFTVQ